MKGIKLKTHIKNTENSFNQNQVINQEILTLCKIFDENETLGKGDDIFNSFK